MSAIFGFLRLDGSGAERDELAAMDGALAHCGPDGHGLWTKGPAALGHRKLEVTPESRRDEQPRVSGGQLILTADAILDNRNELIAEFGLPENEKSLPDSDLILEAYHRWGGDCPKHLLGDFAFAVWDPEAGTLFCARDHMGIRPFYYAHLPGRLFAFATEIKGLLALAEIPRRVDETTVGDFLTLNHSSRTRTFYRDVRRLDAAHSLAVSTDGVRAKRFWSLRPDRRLELPSREAYARALRERIEEAVACRLRCGVRVGAHLSGGLDSTALAVLAARRLREQGERLVTASFMPALEEGWRLHDERPFVDTIKEREELEAHEIVTDSVDYCSSLDIDRPMAVDAGTPEGRTAALMAERGARVVLSGWGGDELATFNGRGYFSELFVKGRWLTLAREARKRRRHYPFRWYRFLAGNVLGYLLPDRLHAWASGVFGGPTPSSRAGSASRNESGSERSRWDPTCAATSST